MLLLSNSCKAPDLIKLSGPDVSEHVSQQPDLVLHVKVMQRSPLPRGRVGVNLVDHGPLKAVHLQRAALLLLQAVQGALPGG